MNPATVTALVPVITQGVNLVRLHAESTTSRHDRFAEIALLERRIELEVERLEHRREMAAAQRELFQRMIAISGAMTARKIDVVLEIFHATIEILKENQASLIREKDQLSERYFAPDTDALTQARIDARKREIDRALDAINECAVRVQAGATNTVAALDPSAAQPMLGWV